MAVWQLQPGVSLSIASPASSRHVARPEEVTGLTPLFLSPAPLPSLHSSALFCRKFHFSATYAPRNCHGEDRMIYKRHESKRRRRRYFLNTPIKHEACLVRLPRHPLSKSQPCLAEAEKQMSWVSLPLLDRAVKIYSWRTLKTAQMEGGVIWGLARFSVRNQFRDDKQ